MRYRVIQSRRSRVKRPPDRRIRRDRGPLDIEVLGLGQASLDFLGRIPVFPGEDEKSELEDLQIQCGGPASTALVALSRLKIRTSFLGAISDDFFGKQIVKGLENEGVDFSFLKIRPGYTSQFAFIAITREDGKRTIFWHRGTVPPLKMDEVDLGPFPNAKVLHLDGLMIEASLEAARQARQLGWKVVMDGGTLRRGTVDLLSLVDILIASERFAIPLVGPNAPVEKALEALSDLGPNTVVITMGSKGSVGRKEKRILFQKPFSVEVADTTGAGDVYHGAYIYGVLQGWSLSECMRFASAASAIKCRSIGARAGIPRMEEITALISDSSES